MIKPVDFANLPLDIHLCILSFLDPPETISLRKTCKCLWLATQERTIWLEAVEKMCANSAVYTHSFPTEEMSVIDLEHASMLPFKWESFVRKSDPAHQIMSHQHQSSGRTFILPCPPSTDPQQHRYVYLIPGGRFLLVLENKVLMLWNLGYPHATSACAEIRLIAQKNTDCLSITTHPSPDGLSIRVLTLRLTSDSTPLQCDMLQIDPLDSEPAFVEIASHATTIPYDLLFTSVCGDMVALVFGPIVKIWDVKTNKCVSWNTCHEPLQILMNAQFVVLVHYRNCTVWRIPKLSEWADSAYPWPDPSLFTTSGKPEPLRVLPYEHEPLESIVKCYGLCDWYTGSPQPLWFDIQKSDGGTVGPTSHRFIADVDGPSPDDFSIRPMRSVPIPRRCFNEFMEPYRVCGNHLVSPWRTPESYHCRSQDVRPTLDGEERVDKVVNLFHRDRSEHWFGWPSYSLCPVSGRLVVARCRTNQIQVIDLFSASPSHEA